MENKKEGYVVFHEHSENCVIVGTPRLYYVLNGDYYGNPSGRVNKKRSNYILWYKIICNDTDCEYDGAISDNLISKLICNLDLRTPTEEKQKDK